MEWREKMWAASGILKNQSVYLFAWIQQPSFYCRSRSLVLSSVFSRMPSVCRTCSSTERLRVCRTSYHRHRLLVLFIILVYFRMREHFFCVRSVCWVHLLPPYDKVLQQRAQLQPNHVHATFSRTSSHCCRCTWKERYGHGKSTRNSSMQHWQPANLFM